IASSKNKLAQEEPNSRIGHIWVSIFRDEIVTIRDKDWPELAPHFTIPAPIQLIDGIAITLSNGKVNREFSIDSLPLFNHKAKKKS
ncbi:MAG: hypothetical protein D6712_13985, partial [Chloroflexi bacterium]